MISVEIVLNVYNSHNSQLGVGLDVILNVDVSLHLMQHRALITAITAVQDLVTLPLHGDTLLLVCTKEFRFFGTFTELKVLLALKFNVMKNLFVSTKEIPSLFIFFSTLSNTSANIIEFSINFPYIALFYFTYHFDGSTKIFLGLY